MKKGYQKPALKKVKLVSEEAVLQGCKFYWVTWGPGTTAWCYVHYNGGYCKEFVS